MKRDRGHLQARISDSQTTVTSDHMEARKRRRSHTRRIESKKHYNGPNELAAKARLEALYAHMTLEEVTEAAPILTAEPPPAGILDMLKPDSGLFVKSEAKPVLDFETEAVTGAPGIWQVLRSSKQVELLTAIPGQNQTEVSMESIITPSSFGIDGTEAYRPPWVDLEFFLGWCRSARR